VLCFSSHHIRPQKSLQGQTIPYVRDIWSTNTYLFNLKRILCPRYLKLGYKSEQ
jgi:hypothetical protein